MARFPAVAGCRRLVLGLVLVPLACNKAKEPRDAAVQAPASTPTASAAVPGVTTFGVPECDSCGGSHD